MSVLKVAAERGIDTPKLAVIFSQQATVDAGREFDSFIMAGTMRASAHPEVDFRGNYALPSDAANYYPTSSGLANTMDLNAKRGGNAGTGSATGSGDGGGSGSAGGRTKTGGGATVKRPQGSVPKAVAARSNPAKAQQQQSPTQPPATKPVSTPGNKPGVI